MILVNTDYIEGKKFEMTGTFNAISVLISSINAWA